MFKDETPLILSLETATRSGSVCLWRGDAFLAFRAGDAKVSHSVNLLDSIEEVLVEGKVKLGEIDLFAAAAGPGSFTGLRIGLATIKSFAATLKRPCLGIQTLHAIAHGAGESGCTLAMLPAGRGEVFAQRLKVTADGVVLPLEPSTHLAPAQLLAKDMTESGLKLAGEGVQLYIEAIRAVASTKGIELVIQDSETKTSDNGKIWTIISNPEPLAVSVAKLAFIRARQGLESGLPQDLQAIYVRLSDAELNEQCRA